MLRLIALGPVGGSLSSEGGGCRFDHWLVPFSIIRGSRRVRR